MPYRRSRPRTAVRTAVAAAPGSVALRPGRGAPCAPRRVPAVRRLGSALTGSGPAPRWAVPAVATALLPHLVPVVTGLMWVALLAGADCGEACEPAVRGPLNVVTLGYSLSFTVTPAALALCWLLAIRRSWSAARWIAAGLAYVPPAMITLGVMLLFVPRP
ncbi:hypothetical protein OHT52_16920 [Streptomyces sp. NBC_00247]|uniref:hypothetical protein n=1 Tax=Streptomyces sp. NBC_00247 TaxID=2975689 RepID=UPI002E2E4A3E|nr:hypothetical protein [Streptomyces sp. NBC_00247]